MAVAAAPTASASPTRALIDALAAADPEPAIARAFQHVAARGGDVPLLLALSEAMARANLAAMARRLLQSLGESAQRHPPIAAALKSLECAPDGELDRTELRVRFTANVEALKLAHPEIAATIKDAHLPPGIRILCSRRGNMHALRDDRAPRFDTVFPFVDERAAASAARIPPPDLTTSLLLVGVPSPPLLARLLQMRADGGYRPPVDVIEPDIEAFVIWLHLINDAAPLRDNRLGLYLGQRAVNDWREFIISTPGRVPASGVLTNHRPGWQPPVVDAAILRQLHEQRRQSQAAIRATMDAQLRHGDATYWRARFAGARRGETPLRIVGFTNRYSTVVQHAMRDLAGAFARQGHTFTAVAQDDERCAAIDVAGALARSRFDLIVAINHLRFEYPDSMPRNVPFVGWIQDHMDHLQSPEAGASVGELDMVVCHAPHVLASLFGYPAARLLASSNLTDALTYSDEPLPECELRAHRCDVSYVAHGSATPEQLCDELSAGAGAPLRALLRTALRLLREHLDECGFARPIDQMAIMLRAEREAGHRALPPELRRAHVFPLVARLHDRALRHQSLQWAANWARSRNRTLAIYGRGWERHPTLGAFARGEIENGRPLRCVCQASTVNLQINGYGALHQRLLDALACGGFVLSRRVPPDFARRPGMLVREIIECERIDTLEALLQRARDDQRLRTAIDQIRALTGLPIAPTTDPARAAHVQMAREANPIADLTTDAGLLSILSDGRFVPHRTAADLPGFEQTVFGSEDEMHRLLDQFTADAPLRREAAQRMRHDVLAHDTIDALVGRVVEAFAT